MKRILILGAGRSSSSLIKYLLAHRQTFGWHIRVADSDKKLADEKVAGHEGVEAIAFDVFDEEQRHDEIKKADLVISMLPASFHIHVAKACLLHGKNMLSASYISDEVRALAPEVAAKNLLFLKECGLDPGLDHMTAMQALDGLKQKGAILKSFKSYTGGLIAPESDNNPWHYKFTWNPRNVVLAGQGTARFIRNGTYKYIPYHRLFTRLEQIHVNGYGDFEGYANRDSLSYRKVYGIENITTIIRGTLRKPGYCSAWNVFVQLGMTDDTYLLEDVDKMTWRNFTNSFLPYSVTSDVESKLCKYINIELYSPEYKKFAWLGLFDDTLTGLAKATPAQALQKKLEEKWQLLPGDKDMIVMQHQFEYELEGKVFRLDASMVTLGEDRQQTAMAKTVGLPLAIAAKLILTGKIKAKGLCIPTSKEIYAPVLGELATMGIDFMEKVTELKK